ncbi:DUF1682 family protein [Melia azedarach]|uniref:DUF1682 family protein n=1 Tax=Melia azedarach TaxID=155640 RepID=A0ACC1Y160_MELAZ|nr:DUF1682 family protein [Melia azedarach]
MRNVSRPISLLTFLLFLLLLSFSFCSVLADSHFEGFDGEDDVVEEETLDLHGVTDLPLTQSDSSAPSPPITTTTNLESSDPQSDSDSDSNPTPTNSDPQTKSPSTTTTFDYWDEDEFEGVPLQQSPVDTPVTTEDAAADQTPDSKTTEEVKVVVVSKKWISYSIEIVCVAFFIMFIVNYFTGKRENENLALAWAAKFATKDSIFEKNFSLLGVGEGNDAPLLLKEGQSVFKFYASGRRYCSGLLATMELKSRHDLISRLYNMVVPCKDEISFEVYMNEDAMDHVVFALAKKKVAKTLQKEFLNRFLVRKLLRNMERISFQCIFLINTLAHIRRCLLFKFALPNAKNMADMTRLVALVPYYIDLIGRYKLSPQGRSKTEAARQKVAQEAYKELQNARQEALQRKKAEKKKMMEEAEAKLSAETLRKKEAKERARQMKKGMPKIKMSRGH